MSGEETKNVEQVVEIPTPIFNYVLIKNPLFNIAQKFEKELSDLPPAEREAYMKEKVRPLFRKMEVLAVGETCTTIKKGDFVATTMENASQGIPFNNNQHVLIRETNFICKW